MDRFKIFINLQVLDEVPRSGRARSDIMAFIKSLESDPTHSGDYSEVDEVGRPIYTKIIGKHAITFWPDSPVKEVKIIRIRKADGKSEKT